MDPRTITKMMVIKRLLESLPEEKRERNMPAIEKTAEKIMSDFDSVVQVLVEGPSLAPKQCHIKGLGQ